MEITCWQIKATVFLTCRQDARRSDSWTSFQATQAQHTATQSLIWQPYWRMTSGAASSPTKVKFKWRVAADWWRIDDIFDALIFFFLFLTSYPLFDRLPLKSFLRQHRQPARKITAKNSLLQQGLCQLCQRMWFRDWRRHWEGHPKKRSGGGGASMQTEF